MVLRVQAIRAKREVIGTENVRALLADALAPPASRVAW